MQNLIMLKTPWTPAEEESCRGPYQHTQIPDKAKTETGSLQWYSVTELQLLLQWAQTETQDVFF